MARTIRPLIRHAHSDIGRSCNQNRYGDEECPCGAMVFLRRDEVGQRPVKTEKERENGRKGVQMGAARIAARPVVPGRGWREGLRTLARNATTRWREPAGHSSGESFLSAQLVEAGGIEPPCRGTSAEASTCVFHRLAFLGPQDSGGQDSSQARARTDVVPRSPARQKTTGSLLWSPIPASQAKPDERRS